MSETTFYLKTDEEKQAASKSILESEGIVAITITPTKEKLYLTDVQNRSLHLYFEWLAESLNRQGIDKKVFFQTISLSVDWNKESVKNDIWKILQDHIYPETGSTRKLDNKKLSDIYDVLNKRMSELFGLHVRFPDEADKANGIAINNFGLMYKQGRYR